MLFRSEFSAPARLDRLPYSLARLTDLPTARALAGQSGVEVLTRGDGAVLALFADTWRLSRVQRDFPDALLEPLVAASV